MEPPARGSHVYRMSKLPRATRAERRREIERVITEHAARQHGVVTVTQLVAAGVHPSAIRRRIESGRLARLHRGVFGVGTLLPPRASLIAAVLACGPHAVLSHGSAAFLHGLLDEQPDGIDVTVPLPGGRSRPRLRIHRVRPLPDEDTTTCDGIPVTTVARTLRDVAAVFDDALLERVIASAERDMMMPPDALDALRDTVRARPGAARLNRVLGRLAGPSFTRSEAERRFLALLRRARLPPPRTNVELGGFEIDFLWPDLGVAVEVDGYRFHGSRTRFETDRRRNARLAAMGVQVVPLSWRQIVHDEVATAVQLGQLLVRAERR